MKTVAVPASEADVSALRVGDTVSLTGEIVITAGLPTHDRLLRCLDGTETLPFALDGAAFFHLGSYNREVDGRFEVLYLNPTTSTRFNPVMPRLIRAFGLRMVGGKGGLDRACVEAMRETGCVYLSFIGGGATVFSRAVRTVAAVGWNDMISHYRLVKLSVEALGPLTVAIDAHGNSVYDDAQQVARGRLPEILERLRAAREGTGDPGAGGSRR